MLALAGCAVDSPPSVGQRRDDIIGGAAVTTDPAVVFLETAGGNCTGTLIAPRVVLTAAHCVFGASGGTVQFRNDGGNIFDTVDITDLFPHRFYDPGSIRRYDIAMLRLDVAANFAVTPIAYNRAPIDPDLAGLPVRVVGFGVTNGTTGVGGGTKRELADIPITRVTDEHVVLGNATRNICFGDSGGPTFIEFNGQERVAAVSSFTSGNCIADSFVTRTDIYADDMLDEVLAAWDGPCQQDGTCVTDGCGTFSDPDCDPCGLNGMCAEGCTRVDLDCPAGELSGEDCDEDDDCEGRACITAPDDPSVKYCSIRCSADDGSSCEAPLSSCQQVDDEFACVYAGATPNALGSECENAEDCRSEICDRAAGICATICTGGEACPSPFKCLEAGEISICTKEVGGGCGCASPHGLGRDALGFVLLLGLSFAFVGRRRLRRS